MTRFVVERRRHWASRLISIGSDLPRAIFGQLQIQLMCAESKICSVKQALAQLKNTTSERNRV